MIAKMKTLQLLFLLLFSTTSSFSQYVFNKIDSLIKVTHSANQNITMSVGILKNNTEYYTSYGNLDRESSVKVNKNSVFEIASITKVLTSNLIAQAHLENKLNIHDFIDPYLPEAYQLQKSIQQKIKISDLASHQSGLPDIDFRKLILTNSQQPVSAVNQDSLATLVNNCSVLTDYGNYRYAALGYILLGQILETIYQKSYDQILKEKLLNPLKTTATFTTDFNVKNSTKGYNPEGGIQEFFNWNITAPAGLVKASSSDMIAFLKAVLNEKSKIGGASVFAEKTQYSKDGREIGLGLGIVNDTGNTIFFKTGDSMGQSCFLGYNRINNWGIIILLNQRDSKLRQSMFNAIYEIIKKSK
ncbi:MAG: CubicO group peptidase (beta-lactamase class C family) [Paraglaciecola sp.]|jgi:CubicO group peptidase (beta-lactamase class C family)